MGKIKYIAKIRELFKKSLVVTAESIRLITKSKGYANLLLSYLKKRGEIKKLCKGCYTIHDEASLIVFCVKPAYLGLYDALSAHGLWEQETIPVIITGRKIREGVRTSLGMNVLIKRTEPKYVFGFEYMEYGGFWLPVSDLEKTVIDFAYFGEFLPKEVLRRLKRKLDKRKVNSYLKRYELKDRRKIIKKLKEWKVL
ncbi:hypothetical protein DRJ16_00825 [Candidatus Woesearchaeota archaeon]|nr:MAG: hypothetical protein DRJ16_00825 [Candidatus Woesearchaeota archaeon]